jgi:hypothetical protein
LYRTQPNRRPASPRGAIFVESDTMASATVRRCPPGRLPKRLRRKRGPKVNPLAEENAAIRQRIDRLETQLKRAETIIEVQKSLGSPWAVRPEQLEERREQMNAVSDLTFQVGIGVACLALAIPCSSFYQSRLEPRIKIAPGSPIRHLAPSM